MHGKKQSGTPFKLVISLESTPNITLQMPPMTLLPSQMLKTKESKGKCPPLHMIYSSPRITLDDRTISTKAYAIEYRRKDGSEVIRKLKEAFSDTNYFLMAKLRYTHPKAFANAIKIQTKSMKETYILPMVNVTLTEIFYLQPALEGITGVKTVIQTRKTHSHGRYNILIDATKFKETKGIIQASFVAIYEKHVPIDAKQNPEALQFYGPPEIPINNEYEESSGEKSFISMSAASFASFDTSNTHDNFETFIPAAGTFLWSNVVQEKACPIPQEVTTPGPDATATAESTEISAMTPRETQFVEEIRSLRVELVEQQRKTAAEMAELRSMLKAFLVHSQPQTDALRDTSDDIPPPEPMVTDDDVDDNSPKRSGNDSPEPTDRRKRPDHKLTPQKLDF